MTLRSLQLQPLKTLTPSAAIKEKNITERRLGVIQFQHKAKEPVCRALRHFGATLFLASVVGSGQQ